MTKKLHIDILTPKQALFFNTLIKKLTTQGVDILTTTRRYREANQMLKLLKIQAYILGEYGGAVRKSKIEASLKRTLKLTEILNEIKPSVSLSFSSPEAARASFGLGIPHITVNDSPHAQAVARLTIPLSRRLLTPYVIPFKAWQEYGATKKMIIRYKALDPFAWLKDFTPDKNILKTLGVSEKEPIVIVRPEETFASYLLDRSKGNILIAQVVQELLKLRDITIIVLPRYEEQMKALKNKFDSKIILAEKVLDGASLLSFSSIFIGGGGTMTAESALMGIPTFSCYPNRPTYVEKFLIKKKLVLRINNAKILAASVAKTLENLGKFKQLQISKAKDLTSTMEDPAEIILKTVSHYF